MANKSNAQLEAELDELRKEVDKLRDSVPSEPIRRVVGSKPVTKETERVIQRENESIPGPAGPRGPEGPRGERGPAGESVSEAEIRAIVRNEIVNKLSNLNQRVTLTSQDIRSQGFEKNNKGWRLSLDNNIEALFAIINKLHGLGIDVNVIDLGLDGRIATNQPFTFALNNGNPATEQKGTVYYDISDNKLYVRTDSAWVALH